jgi:hypothetical protein
MLDTLEIVHTNKPPAPPSVNDKEFLTYENSTLGIKMQYPLGCRSKTRSINQWYQSNISRYKDAKIRPLYIKIANISKS